MNSNYLLNAFTIRKEGDFSKMVLVMDAEKAAGKHVTYQEYVNKTSNDQDLNHHEIIDERHFEYISRESHNSVISSENKRIFSERYKNSLPIMSKDQNYVCFPRFSTVDKSQASEGIIDVYDCSGPDGKFWKSKKNVDITDGFYRFSINMNQADVKNFFRIVFSTNSKYLCILSKRNAYIFDTTTEVTSEDDDGTRHLEPIHTFGVQN